MLVSAVMLAVIVVLSSSLTFLALRYAVKHRVLAIPNERTSHEMPTPRGGGIAIILCFFLSVIFLQAFSPTPQRALWALLGAGALIAVLGFVDDHDHVPAPIRFFLQTVAALWMLFGVGGYEALWIGNDTLKLGILGLPCAVLATVWFTNLYNFMDGIDGYAASEAIFVALVSVFLFFQGGDQLMATLAMVLAASSVGFLLWNWAPASIFMGDVGSTSIGFTFACFAMLGSSRDHISPLYWVLALSVFIADATYTLVQRVREGEPFYQPHRSHAFQQLVQLGYSHQKVVRLMLAFNGCVIMPCMVVSMCFPRYLLSITVMVYVFLYLCWRLARSRHRTVGQSH